MTISAKWDHLHLKSADPDSTASFYVSTFAAEHRARTENGDQLRVTIDLMGVLLFIDRVVQGAPSMPDPPFGGLEHLAFSVDDLDEAVADLKTRSVPVFDGPRQLRPGLRIAFLQAPDNVRIELLERRD